MEDTRATTSACFRQLPAALQLHILSFLDPNERALSGRLVFPNAAAGLAEPDYCTASLSQPLPPHAVPWGVEAGQQHVRQLPFWHKLQLLCTAAASACEVNLEVALALLQPGVFPELLQSPDGYPAPGSTDSYSVYRGLDGYGERSRRFGYWDPGVAAVKAGHPQLLGWLLRHCPGVVDGRQVLEAAAKHCSLEGLQVAHAALQVHLGGGVPGRRHMLRHDVLNAAASSHTPDALEKVEWLLSVYGPTIVFDKTTAAAAARAGELGRLRWLQARGCPMDLSVLQSALEHADLPVAQWLVDEAGVSLPGAGGGGGQGPGWSKLLTAAAKSAGGVVKLQWLRERGAPPLDAKEKRLRSVAAAAIAAGQVQVAQYLWTAFGAGGVLFGSQAAELAGRSGSIPMLQWLRQAGVELSHTAYEGAGKAGSLPVVRWLAQEAGVSAAGMRLGNMQDLILRWPSDTAARSRELLQAVQLMAFAGYSNWGMHHVAVMWGKLVERGDPALMQYLEQQQLQQQHLYLQQQQQQQRQQHQHLYTQRHHLYLQQQQEEELQLARSATARMLWDAVEVGCDALLEWLVQQQQGGPDVVGHGSPYLHPAKYGNLGTLNALRRLGVPWGTENVVVRGIMEGCRAPALQWLVEQGAPVGEDEEMEEAVRDGKCSSPVLRWMDEQGWLADDLGSEEVSDDDGGQGAL